MSKQTPPAKKTKTVKMYGMVCRTSGEVYPPSLTKTRSGSEGCRERLRATKANWPVRCVTLTYDLPPAPRPARKD